MTRKVQVFSISLLLLIDLFLAKLLYESISSTGQFNYATLMGLLPTMLLFIFILLRIVQVNNAYSLFDPGLMLSIGFLLFYSMGILMFPGKNTEVYVSRKRVNFLIFTYSISTVSFLIGYYTALIGYNLKKKFAKFNKYKEKVTSSKNRNIHIDSEKLWYYTCFTFILVLVIFIIVGVLRSYNPFLGLLQTRGYGGDVYWNISYAKSNFAPYLSQVLGILPISLGIMIGIYFGLEGRKSKFRFFVSFLAILFILLLYISRGTRFRLIYSIGGALLAFFAVKYFLDYFCQPTISSRYKTRFFWLSVSLIIVMGLIVPLRNEGGVYTFFVGGGRRGVQDVNLLSQAKFISGGDDVLPRILTIKNIVNNFEFYTFGKTFAAPLFTWVPRTLWPSKPSASRIYIQEKVRLSNANRAFGLLGEFYLNFGYLGIFLASWLLGLLARFWFIFLTKSITIHKAIVLVVSSLCWILMVRGAFHTAVAPMLYSMLFVLLILRLSSTDKSFGAIHEVRPQNDE